MAGSRKIMVYESDDTINYWVNIDESNGEAAGFIDFDGVAAAVEAPKSLQMRRVICEDPGTGARRTIPVGSITDGVWTGAVSQLLLPLLGPAGTAATLTAFNIVRRIGESVREPKANDTGLQDGDAT